MGSISQFSKVGETALQHPTDGGQQSILANLKGVKLSFDEQEFIKEYRKLEELEREKGIKFFQCVGDPPHTKEFVESIDAKRKQIIDDGLREMREQDCTRFDTCIDQEKVVVNTTTLNDLTAKPKWDAFENNHFAMRRRLVSIFLRVSNKLICRIRAGHRLKKIWTWINNNGVKTREDMKLKVTEDNKIAKNTRLIDDTESVNDIRNIKFEFSFGASKIKQNLQKLPLEYETNISSFLEKVEANPPTNFDDLTQFDPLEVLDFEIQNYS